MSVGTYEKSVAPEHAVVLELVETLRQDAYRLRALHLPSIAGDVEHAADALVDYYETIGLLRELTVAMGGPR